MRDTKKIFYYFELRLLGVSAMPQQTGDGDDDGDDNGVDSDVEEEWLIIYLMG